MNANLVETSALRGTFRKLGERMGKADATDEWQDTVVDLLDSGKRSLRISTRLIDGKVVISLEPSAELLRHL